MASAEYYAVTGDEKCLKEAKNYYKLVKTIYDDPSSDPFKITPKFLDTAPQMRGLANTMVMMLISGLMRMCDPENSEEYANIEKKLISEILDYHYNEKFGVLLEGVGPNGEYLGEYSAGRVVNPGHSLEAAWCLLNEAEELNDASLLGRIEKVYEGAFRYGWDKEYGGLLYFVDVENNPPQAYEHDMKLWWVHTEAIIAAIKLYRATGKEKYWDDFIRMSEYAIAHFCDAEYGEWYGYLRRDGSATEPTGKGNIFKGPFHVPRMYCEVLTELEQL
jgi:N-acylglucosamine 2-epimerase